MSTDVPYASRPSARDVIVLRPSTGWLGWDLRELWPYRELAFFLVWKDVKVRYKQAALGAGWAVIQPLMLMLVFSVFLGHFAKLPSDGLPYPVFTLAALVPWLYFTSAIGGSAECLTSNVNLVSKIYFPRLLLPIAATVGPLVDFSIAMVVLVGLIIVYGVTPSIGLVALPALLLLACATAFGAGTLLAALNVRYRDFRYVVPFLIQFLLFATPVAYSAQLVSGDANVLLGLNPMSSVVEGFRWAMLGTGAPPLAGVCVSVGVALVSLVSGLVYFQRVERTFADII